MICKYPEAIIKKFPVFLVNFAKPVQVAFKSFLHKSLFSLKVGLSPSKKFYFICLNETPLKMMKNAFYFILILIRLGFWKVVFF